MRIKLSEKGRNLHGEIDALYRQHVTALTEGVIDADALAAINQSLRTMERFWADQLRFSGR